MRKRKRGEGLVQEILILVALGTERWEEGYKQNTAFPKNQEIKEFPSVPPLLGIQLSFHD